MHQSFGAGSLLASTVLAGLSVTGALTSSQLGRLSGRFSAQAQIRASFLLSAAALCMVPLAPGVWSLFVATVIFGVAQGMNVPNVYSLLNKGAPDEEHRGAFVSLNSSVLRIGQFLGPALMAAAVLPFGLDGAYLAVAALTAGMFLASLFLIR